jgi:hypothetical protein
MEDGFRWALTRSLAQREREPRTRRGLDQEMRMDFAGASLTLSQRERERGTRRGLDQEMRVFRRARSLTLLPWGEESAEWKKDQ